VFMYVRKLQLRLGEYVLEPNQHHVINDV
jgi:hypothetical protein